jgi:hypothetical protein
MPVGADVAPVVEQASSLFSFEFKWFTRAKNECQQRKSKTNRLQPVLLASRRQERSWHSSFKKH